MLVAKDDYLDTIADINNQYPFRLEISKDKRRSVTALPPTMIELDPDVDKLALR